MVLPLPDNVRYTRYSVFRTVQVEIPCTGGTRTDLYRREDQFATEDWGIVHCSWQQRPFKETVT